MNTKKINKVTLYLNHEDYSIYNEMKAVMPYGFSSKLFREALRRAYANKEKIIANYYHPILED